MSASAPTFDARPGLWYNKVLDLAAGNWIQKVAIKTQDVKARSASVNYAAKLTATFRRFHMLSLSQQPSGTAMARRMRS